MSVPISLYIRIHIFPYVVEREKPQDSLLKKLHIFFYFLR